MLIKVEEGNPFKVLNERELIEARHGPGEYELQAEDLRAVSRELRLVQSGKAAEGAFGRLSMSIPAEIYFQMAVDRPGCFEEEEADKSFATMWDEFADMRMRNTRKGRNPFKK